jgi:hypothetical protein
VEVFPFETISNPADGVLALIPTCPQIILQERISNRYMIFFIIKQL